MKILTIICSLRKKHTYEAAKRFEDAHRAYGADCEYEYLFLKDLNMQTCNGCFLCISKGEQYCPLKDDRDYLLEKVDSADCIILASPNYVMNVNWITKNLIDRLAYILHRPRFFDKRFILLLTSGNFMGTTQAFKALSVLPSGGKTIGKLVLYTAPELNEKQRNNKEKIFMTKANRIFKVLDREYKHNAPYSYLFWFASFKSIHDKNKKTLPADYEYYKDKEYFIDLNLPFLKRIIIKVFTRFFRFVMG